MAQSVTASLQALTQVLVDMHDGEPDTLVTLGDPGNYQPDLLISVMGVVGPVTRPTMRGVSTAKRTRDKQILVEVLISAYAPGGPEAQAVANDAAWGAAELLEDYFRVSPNETLGGACYDAFVAQHDLQPGIAWEDVDGADAPVAAGRVAVVTTTVQISIRLS